MSRNTRWLLVLHLFDATTQNVLDKIDVPEFAEFTPPLADAAEASPE
jgi:hypothetical protein